MELALRLATNASRPSWIDVGDQYRRYRNALRNA